MATQRILTVSQIAALAGLFERANGASEAQFMQILGDLAVILDDVLKPRTRHVDMALSAFLDSAAKSIPKLLQDNTAQLMEFPAAAARFQTAMAGVVELVNRAQGPASPKPKRR